MKILILGGTIFLGRHTVNSALARGHEVTLFNRGIHNQDLFPDIEKLKGDRKGDFKSLTGKSFDAVIDTCGLYRNCQTFWWNFKRQNKALHIYIKHISLQDFSEMGLNENSEPGKIEDESTEEITGETYGPLKFL